MVFLEDRSETIHSRSDDPLELVSVTEGLAAIGADSRFALIELVLFGEDFEFPIESAGWCKRRRKECSSEMLASPATSNAPCWFAKTVDRSRSGIASRLRIRYIRHSGLLAAAPSGEIFGGLPETCRQEKHRAGKQERRESPAFHRVRAPSRRRRASRSNP